MDICKIVSARYCKKRAGEKPFKIRLPVPLLTLIHGVNALEQCEQPSLGTDWGNGSFPAV